MEARYIFQVITKWSWLIILAGLIGGAAGLVVSFLQPKIYEASATVYLVSPDRNDYTALLGAQQAAKAFVLIPQSSTVLEEALQAAGDTSLSPSQLSSMVTVDNNLDSQFVVIQVRDSDPNRAARLATAIAQQSIAQFEATATDSGQVKQFVQQEMSRLEIEIQNLEKELATLQSSGGGRITPAQSAIISQLSEDLTLHSQLLGAYEGIGSIQASLLQPAQIPQKPIAPVPLLGVILGVLAGLSVMVGVVLFLERNDDIVRTPAKVAQVTGFATLLTLEYLPMIAKQVPWQNGRDEAGEDAVKSLVTVARQAPGLKRHTEIKEDARPSLPTPGEDGRAPINNPNVNGKGVNGFQLPEAFLTMGILLTSEHSQLTSSNSNSRSLLITSPEDGDGKTVVASMIALGLARSGVQVVLVDANLRKPGVHKIFGLPNGEGLSSLLCSSRMGSSSGNVFDPSLLHLQQTHEPNLAVLPAGPMVDSPVQTLSSSGMTAILHHLSQKAFLVIDSPAVLTCSESVVLADMSDSILMVLNARSTAVAKLDQSHEILTRVNGNILGVVLNEADNHN